MINIYGRVDLEKKRKGKKIKNQDHVVAYEVATLKMIIKNENNITNSLLASNACLKKASCSLVVYFFYN